MKYSVKALFLLLSGLFVSVSAVTDLRAASMESSRKSGVYLSEIGIGSGYAWGKMLRETRDLAVYPVFARIGFTINSLVGMEGSKSTLLLAVEPFVNSITEPVSGVETGCGVGLRYLHPISRPLDLFMEGSASPMFLSIRSVEQGRAGFNFLLQSGLGLQYKVTEGTAVFAGYRFRHISHGGLADRPNIGINSNALVAGISWLY